MNANPSVSYPDADSAAVDWSAIGPRFYEWQDKHIFTLCQDTLNVLYDSTLSDAYKQSYAKSTIHAIQNIIRTKAENTKQS